MNSSGSQLVIPNMKISAAKIIFMLVKDFVVKFTTFSSKMLGIEQI